MIAYSYLRFSTPDQIKGDSLRRQLEKSEKYATENGLTLDTTTRMQDLGLSAFDRTNIVKGELGAFLRAVEQKRIPIGSYLLVESLDRLSRANVMDALQPFINILNAGIIIVTLGDNQKYSRESVSDNWTMLMYSIMIMSRAHEESATKSMRIKASWVAKKAKIKDGVVLTSRVPYWMEVVDKKIQLIPERAEVVRRIFDLSKSGNGTPTITQVLNRDTPAWSKSGRWYEAYVVKLLQSVACYGAIQLNDEIIDDYYPPVVSKDEWLYVANLKSERKLNIAPGNRVGAVLSNIFSGNLFCGYCDAKMVLQSYPNIPKQLHCYGAKSGATKCACVNVPYKDVEAHFLFFVSNLDIATLFGVRQSNRVEELEQELITTSAHIDTLKRKVDNLYVAIEEDALPGLVKRLRTIEAEQELNEVKKGEILQQINAEKMSSSSGNARRAALLKLMRLQAHTTDDLQLRMIRESLHEQIKSFVEKIEIFPTGPSLNRKEREMKFIRVHFRSGEVRELNLP